MADATTSPKYRVQNKHIYRASIVELQMGTRSDGSPNIVRQPGPMRRYDVGSVIEDLTPDELAAFPDRLALVDEQTQQAMPPEEDPSLAINAPLRGVHEPASDIDAVVHKPPLTGPEVEAKLHVEAEVGKVQAEQATQQAEMDKKLQETRDNAMKQQVGQAVERQRAAARSGQAPAPTGAMPVSTSPAASSAQAVQQTPPEEGAARRRPS